MTTRSTIELTNLTYSELLATVPWVALLPYPAVAPCESVDANYHRGRGRACKTTARLVHYDLDGSHHYFCHHHLYQERWSPEHIMDGDARYPEVCRMRAFERRCFIERKRA